MKGGVMRYLRIVAVVAAAVFAPSPLMAGQQSRSSHSPWAALFAPGMTVPGKSTPATISPRPLFFGTPPIQVVLPCPVITMVPQDDRHDRKIKRLAPKNPKPAARAY